MTIRTLSSLAVLASFASLGAAGTFSTSFSGSTEQWSLLDSANPLGSAVYGTNYFVTRVSDEVAGATLLSDANNPSLSDTVLYYQIVEWSPSYQGETPPTTAYVSYSVADNLFGPSGSSTSISQDGTTLDNTLGTQGTYNGLYSGQAHVALDESDGKGNMLGRFYWTSDTISTAGGATAIEQVTITNMQANPPALNARLTLKGVLKDIRRYGLNRNKKMKATIAVAKR